MIKIQYQGRLGNRMIQYAAAHLFACNTGVQLDPNSARLDFIKTFNVRVPAGRAFEEFIDINESNYFQHLYNANENAALKEISGFQCSFSKFSFSFMLEHFLCKKSIH